MKKLFATLLVCLMMTALFAAFNPAYSDYQFYNLQYLRWKAANVKVGKHCRMEGKMHFSLSAQARLEIGDDFICRSGFGAHILGQETSSIHVFSGGGGNY